MGAGALSGLRAEFLIIGGGMAGTSAAAELAAFAPVIVLERESQPAYHSTGRSAAMFVTSYGPKTVRALNAASRPFLEAPPDRFADHPILTPRGILMIGREDQAASMAGIVAETGEEAGLAAIPAEEALRRVPALRPGYVACAAVEPDASDIDVHGLLQGYQRMLRARDGQILTDAEVERIEWTGGHWQVFTRRGMVEAGVLIDAAGAWADHVGTLAGAEPVGLSPKRRTAITFDPPPDLFTSDWPLILDCEEQFYLKPEGGRLLASPADETPMDPCDVQPDEIDIATAVDRVENATTLTVRRVTHRWAGLRTFAPDKVPVAGWDNAREAFFWLAGQGGYGIQTAPALARLTAALARQKSLPGKIADWGVEASDVSPQRLRKGPE